jgi:hypothetical protein
LAKNAGINRLTLRLYESQGLEPVSAETRVLGKLLRFLESEGIQFHDDGSVTLGTRARSMKAAILNREAAAP